MAGQATLDAGANDILLGDTGTDAVNLGSLDATADDVTVTEDSAMVVDNLAATTATLTAAGDITDDDNATIAVAGKATLDAGANNILLGDTGSDLVNLGSIDATAADVTVTEDSAMQIDNLDATTATLTAAGDITDDDNATIAVAGKATLDAGANNILLGDTGSDLVNLGSIDATAADVTVTEDSAMQIDNLDATTATLTAAGDITDDDNATIAVAGKATLDAGANNILLGDTGSDLVNLGSIDATAADVTVTEDSAMQIDNLDATTATLTAAGDITDDDNATIAVAGKATLDAGANNILLGDTGSDLVNLGSIDATAADVTVTEDSAMQIDNLDATTATLTAAGDITDDDNATIAVAGKATLDAGANNILLGDTGSDLVNLGSIDATAADVTVTEDSAMQIDNLDATTATLTAAGDITDDDNATIAVAGKATLDAGANNILLGDTGSDLVNLGSIDATAADVTVTEDSAMQIDNLDATTATLTAAGDITDDDNATIAVAGKATLDAGANNILLGDTGSDLVNLGSIDATAADVTVTEDSAMQIDNLDATTATLTAAGDITDDRQRDHRGRRQGHPRRGREQHPARRHRQRPGQPRQHRRHRGRRDRHRRLGHADRQP